MQTVGELWGVALAAAIASGLWSQPSTALAAGVVLTTTDPKITTDKDKHTTKLTLYNITDSSADVAAAVDGAQRGDCTISPAPTVIAASQSTEITLTYTGSCQVDQGVPTKLTIASNDANSTVTTIRTTVAKPDAKISIAPRLQASAMAAGIATGILLLALVAGHYLRLRQPSPRTVRRVADTADLEATISSLRKLLRAAIEASKNPGTPAAIDAKTRVEDAARYAVKQDSEDLAAKAVGDAARPDADETAVAGAVAEVKRLIDATADQRELEAEEVLKSLSWGALLSGLGSKWSFKDSWITNVTIGATALIALFAASDVLTTVFGSEQKDAIAFMAVTSAIATVLVSLAPLLIKVISSDPDVPIVIGLYISGLIVILGSMTQIWGATVQVAALVKTRWPGESPPTEGASSQTDTGAVSDLISGRPVGIVYLIAVLITLTVLAYAWRSLLSLVEKGVAPLPKGGGGGGSSDGATDGFTVTALPTPGWTTRRRIPVGL